MGSSLPHICSFYICTCECGSIQFPLIRQYELHVLIELGVKNSCYHVRFGCLLLNVSINDIFYLMHLI